MTDRFDAIDTYTPPVSTSGDRFDTVEARTQLVKPAYTGDLADLIPDVPKQADPNAPEPSLYDKLLASAKTGANVVSSAVTAMPAMLYGVARDVYERTAGNSEKGVSKAEQYANDVQKYAPQYTDPLTQEYTEKTGNVLGSIPAYMPHLPLNVGARAQLAEQFAKKKAADLTPSFRGNTAGAAEAPISAMAKAENVSPEMLSEIQAKEADGTINPVIAKRHINTDALPSVQDENGNTIKAQLSEGMATQDPEILSDEKNFRKNNPALITLMNNNNKAEPLILEKFRDQAAPDVFFKNDPEEGQFYMDKLNEVQNQLEQTTANKYKKFFDAANSTGAAQIPLDGQTFANNAFAALKSKWVAEDLPPKIQSRLESVASGETPMNYENYVQLDKILSREQRAQAIKPEGGSSGYAVGLVRDALNNIPLAQGMDHLQPLYQDAKNSAKLEFDLRNPDKPTFSPAYKAVAEGTARPDTFARQFITGDSKTAGVNEIQNMLNLFPDDEQVHQSLAYSALKDIKDSSVNGKDALKSETFSKSLKSWQDSGTLDKLLPPSIIDGLTKLDEFQKLNHGSGGGGNFIQGNPHQIGLGGKIMTGVGNLAAGAAEYTTSKIPYIGKPIVGAFKAGTEAYNTQLEAQALAERNAKSVKIGAGLDYKPRSQ